MDSQRFVDTFFPGIARPVRPAEVPAQLRAIDAGLRVAASFAAFSAEMRAAERQLEEFRERLEVQRAGQRFPGPNRHRRRRRSRAEIGPRQGGAWRVKGLRAVAVALDDFTRVLEARRQQTTAELVRRMSLPARLLGDTVEENAKAPGRKDS